ncbi:iron permease [Bifidobacterium aemilianum]|uniref:Iron permease n=1 Tax=Bifidobacterium aemilianum TaxID=2493120 RepID=A0A366K995_9BIFI|nr:FTR1 family protein [Bifidobacterium aemilianum]RBP97211.1 iron permease [Bifidobacterium aemilianum]
MLALLFLCAILIGSLMPAARAQAQASGSTDSAAYATWSQAAQAAGKLLSEGQFAYESGDATGAASDFMAAYNTVYIPSGLGPLTGEKLGADRRSAMDDQFQSLQSLALEPGHGDQIGQAVQTLSVALVQAGQELDSRPELTQPQTYAAQQDEQIKADRKRLDAAKKHKNHGKGDRTWTEVAQEMTPILDQAYQKAADGQGRQGADLVNKAYYQYYEKLGFEKNVMNAISGSRVSEVEYQFKMVRSAMSSGKPAKSVKPQVDELKAMLVTDAKLLDGGAADQVNSATAFLTSAFGQAFVVLLREGLEAILVVAAIIAYLVKAGYKSKVKTIYWGILAGLAASGVMALLFSLLFNGNGPQQEILEGVVALIAMVMLLYTSNWMLSKSSTESWTRYIKSQTTTAISKGSVISLAMLSFLAVFREGAETVMFYQAIFAMAPSGSAEIWMGFAAAAVLLVIIFVIIRFTSVKIPIRPFFAITSALMAVMVVIFAGGGVHALIEGDLVPASYIPGLPTSDWLGLYPYWQTIGAQILALIVVIALFAVSLVRQRRAECKTALASNGFSGQSKP